MLAPAHVSIIKYVSFDGIAAMGLACCVFCGAMLPAPGLLTACSLKDSQDVPLFAQGKAMTNLTCVFRLGISTATGQPLLCRLDVESRPSVSPLHRQRLSVAFCTRPSRGLSFGSRSTFSDRRRFVPCILGLVFAFFFDRWIEEGKTVRKKTSTTRWTDQSLYQLLL